MVSTFKVYYIWRGGNMCKVSVIVAAFNIEQYIERCISSITNQTLDSIEIIIVNDGSKDNTLSIVTKLSDKDKRIKIINKENGGLIEARKSGLEAASGEYILFVDGDDWLDTITLEKLYSKAKGENLDIVLYNGFKAYGDKLEPLLSFTEEIELIDDYIKLVLANKILPSICLKFIKNKFLIDNSIQFPSNITYAEDLATTAVLFMNSPKVGYIKDKLYYYFQRSTSVTKAFNNQVLDIPKALEFIKAKLLELKLYDKYPEEFNYLAYCHLYYYKILDSNIPDEIRDEFYKRYKNMKINIDNNKYYLENKREMHINIKFKNLIFNISYTLGKLLLKIMKYAKARC
jgi:glycosyltransferase involved in cell wall biosynthesis